MAKKTVAPPEFQQGTPTAEGTRPRERYITPGDIYETPEGLVVMADLPSVTKRIGNSHGIFALVSAGAHRRSLPLPGLSFASLYGRCLYAGASAGSGRDTQGGGEPRLALHMSGNARKQHMIDPRIFSRCPETSAAVPGCLRVTGLRPQRLR
jgi:hypothetical protein